MQTLTEIALEKAVRGVFTRPEVACWIGGSPDRQFSLLKRAMAAGEVVRIHRGLYCLATKYLRQRIDPLVLAQMIYGPSYISLETALSYHGWIPEAVYAVTSTSLGRSREFDTPMGHFSFTRVPQETFYAEVTQVEKEEAGSFLLASPLKALADYVYAHRCDWNSTQPVVESLRVDESSLVGADPASFDRLLANYPARRVQRFLKGLRKDLIR
jgi:predicted transcriptional regulator of viral defense system